MRNIWRSGDVLLNIAESQAAQTEVRTLNISQSSLEANSFRAFRWTLVVLGFFGVVVLLLANRFEVCTIETSTGNDGSTVTKTCKGPEVTDASVVAVAALLVLLIVPDMSEVGIFGVSLKRRLAQAEQKVSESEAKAERLENRLEIQNLRVDTLSQNLVAANAQAVNNVYLVSTEDIKNIDAALPEKARMYARGEVPSMPATGFLAPEAEEKLDPLMVVRLIQNWETLAWYLSLTPYHRGANAEDIGIAISLHQANLFRRLFEDELNIVRAARNNVAHAKPITDDDLSSAVDISERLLEALRG